MISIPLTLILTTVAVWQGERPSGPEPGAAIPALRVQVAAGPGEGQRLDVASDREGRPTIYAFVQAAQLDRPMARLLRTIDEALAARDPSGELRLAAVWLTDQPENALEFLPRAQQSLRLTRTTWTVYEGQRQGPDGWSINDAVGITFVVARDRKVVRSFGLDSWSDADARRVLSALDTP
ncbi:MAG: hypothetical protein KatS3mg108_1996 [Isosphaeraceae bacterium]|jgi:hypothetical protein|nr:MAG: hypothetical protein KatS3mg108_1996 [Isosphaeraceae bacterium]